MIALDTNILVRFFAQDHPVHSPIADRVMASLSADQPGFICREALIELVWVLGRTHRLTRSDIADILEGLMSAPELVLEGRNLLGRVIGFYERDGFGFADLMIWAAAKRAGAEPLLTFDKKAATLDGGELLTDEWRP